MTGASEWTGRVGRSWAAEWQRTDRSFRHLTSRLLDRAGHGGFARCVDIGCGAGEVSLYLARANPGSEVLGLDISASLLETARQRASGLTDLRFELADASRWTCPVEDAPDLLVSRHGVMFFDDPVAAFAHLRGQAGEGVRLVFSCFRERSDNIWAKELSAIVPGQAAPGNPRAPGPFAFGDASYVEAILQQAGWHDVQFEPVDYPMIAGEGEGALDDATGYFLRIGPAAGAIAELDGELREEAIGRLRTMLASYQAGGTIALPAACWIVTAR